MTATSMSDLRARLSPEVGRWLPEIVERIVDEADPINVLLFGSHARGDATEQSDLDLLVIVDAASFRPDTATRIRRRLSDLPVAKDVVVSTDERVRRYGHLVGTILRPALREGISLYERR